MDWDEEQDESDLLDERELDAVCSCGRYTVGEGCQECGTPLCPMCFETGAGFCSHHPSPDYQPSMEGY